jgi:hypothetical protein
MSNTTNTLLRQYNKDTTSDDNIPTAAKKQKDWSPGMIWKYKTGKFSKLSMLCSKKST